MIRKSAGFRQEQTVWRGTSELNRISCARHKSSARVRCSLSRFRPVAPCSGTLQGRLQQSMVVTWCDLGQAHICPRTGTKQRRPVMSIGTRSGQILRQPLTCRHCLSMSAAEAVHVHVCRPYLPDMSVGPVCDASRVSEINAADYSPMPPSNRSKLRGR